MAWGRPQGLDRNEEREICERRGHESDGATYTSNPPQYRCKFCGTMYRVETRVVETDRR